jgi:predicted acylesterase/phospholipase RssA
MKPTKGSSARQLSASDQIHLVCSSGGSRAILGSAGAIAALDQAGLKDFVSIGGISGGSIPTAMFAAGLGSTETLRLAVDIDFSSMLTRHGSIARILLAYMMQGRLAQTRPRKGVMSSEKLGVYLDEKVPVWPDRYWTMAVQGENKIYFTQDGVFELTPDGKRNVLSNKPAPLGLAVRASCAVPGIISAVPYKGRFLFDGALTREGRCPIALPIAHKGALPENIIAVDAGDDDSKMSQRITRLWGILCGGNCVPHVEEKVLTEKDVAVLIKPDLGFFRSLQFTLTRDQKWRAVMAGYVATVKQLKKAKLLEGEQLEKMQVVVSAFQRIESMCKFSEEGVLTRLTEQLMREHKLF